MRSCLYGDREISLEKYKKEKIDMFRKDFLIRLTNDQIAKIMSLDSTVKVDNYCRQIINDTWK